MYEWQQIAMCCTEITHTATYKCKLYRLLHVHTVVWEKLVVGNIHEKKSVVKIFILAGYNPL